MPTATKTKGPDASQIVEQIPEMAAPEPIGEPEVMTLDDIRPTPERVKAAEAVAAQTTQEPAAEPEAEAEEDAGTVTTEAEPEAEAVDPNVLTFAKQLMDQWNADPSKAAAQLYNALSASEQTKFLQTLTSKQPDEFDPATFDAEKDLFPHIATIKGMGEFKQNVEKNLPVHADFINTAHLKIEMQAAVNEAVAEALGIKIPVADMKAMTAALAAGKSYSDAVAPFKAALSKVKANVKQALKERPAGSTSSANETITFLPNESLADMLKKAKANGMKVG